LSRLNMDVLSRTVDAPTRSTWHRGFIRNDIDALLPEATEKTLPPTRRRSSKA
jgi:hypothetical protein